MKKQVVFDCDEVLANLRKEMQHIISDIIGRKITIEDMTDWNMGKAFGFDFDVVLEEIHNRELLQQLDPETHAAETVQHFKDLGYTTYVLTARGYLPNALHITEQWLNQHNIPIDEVIITLPFSKKTDYLCHLGDVELYLDDHPAHVFESVHLDNVNHSYLMNRPWNTREKEVHSKNIDCISELQDIFR